MAKAKSRAVVQVADGAGGLVVVQDRRFEAGDWPFHFDIPKELADAWLLYLAAECRRRGWSNSSIAQMEARENSGSITITRSNPSGSELAVIWERKRDGPLRIRAKSAGTSEFPHTEVQDLFARVNESSARGEKEPFLLRGCLQYQGLAWRGELWLDEKVRLSPPSQQYDGALLGPRIVLLDAEVEGIDHFDASARFNLMAREMSVFLSVVLGHVVRLQGNGSQEWTWSVGTDGNAFSEVRYAGYVESSSLAEMPDRGRFAPVPTFPVTRPDLGMSTSLHLSQCDQLCVPEDILTLWEAFRRLAPEQKQQFLQSGNLLQLAFSLGREYATTSFALLVAACEALKPRDEKYRDHNVYNVVEALLGREHADTLREEWFQAQVVRNAHFHAGELRGEEFARYAMMSSFQDPSFDQARRALGRLVPATFVKWLSCGGTFNMPPRARKARWRIWAKKWSMSLLWLIVGLMAGLILGGLLIR